MNISTARMLDGAPLFRVHIVEHAGRRTGDVAATHVDVLVAPKDLSPHTVQREIEKLAVRCFPWVVNLDRFEWLTVDVLTSGI